MAPALFLDKSCIRKELEKGNIISDSLGLPSFAESASDTKTDSLPEPNFAPEVDAEASPMSEDPTAESRKSDHIELAFKAQVLNQDPRFDYEPMLAAHPDESDLGLSFMGKSLKAPLWISSMTGGTELAGTINHRLAQACGEYGIGMGLGSCRALFESDKHLPDFDVREDIGSDVPLYANIGIAQLEQLISRSALEEIDVLLKKLRADGIIIHVNPFQEWLQPEGDKIHRPAIASIQELLDQAAYPVVVKEVGQGMGPASLEALFKLPIEAIEFAAHGGTNFALLEMMRGNEVKLQSYNNLSHQGHSALDMVRTSNRILEKLGKEAKCQQVIISGGIKDFLEGYYLNALLQCPSIYGQGSAYLKHARVSYEQLADYLSMQIRGLALAQAYLRPRIADSSS